jgi:CcmD family protein
MTYLLVAFLILWAITFGYVFSLGARQKRLQQELELLRKESAASREQSVASRADDHHRTPTQTT